MIVRFKEAEKMHCRAIQIKIAILGPHDYEVGLSIGHLASLYNYHMAKYLEAEELYLTGISISMLPHSKQSILFLVVIIDWLSSICLCRCESVWRILFGTRV